MEVNEEERKRTADATDGCTCASGRARTIGAAIAWCRAWRARGRGRGLEPSPGNSCCALLYLRAGAEV
eukprot:scaffold12002_cov115-Isochrysis_galbana.AAC.2